MQVIQTSSAGLAYYYKLLENINNEPPMVFVSGAFQSMATWDKTMHHFHPYSTVISLDLPGTGRADLLEEDQSFDVLATALRDLLDELSIPRINIVAASYGTPIAYRFSQMYPDRLNRMALGGIMKDIPPDKVESIWRSVRFLQAGDMENFANEIMGGLMCHEQTEQIPRYRLGKRLMRSQLMNMTNHQKLVYEKNSLRLLQHEPLDWDGPPETRTLVFTGERDVFTRPEFCREVALSIPGSSFTTIQNADHLFHLQQLEVTWELLRSFFYDPDLVYVEGCNYIEHISSQEVVGF